MVQGVQLNQRNHERRQSGKRVEQRGCIHPCHRHNTVQVLQIPEIDRQCAEQHRHTAAENQQQQKRHPDQQNRPVEGRAGNQHNQHNGRQTEQKVHKAGKHPADGKDKLGDIDLFNQRRIAQHAAHTHIGALVEEVEHRVAADQIQRKVRDIVAEHIGKDQRLQKHHKQRVEDAPHVAQNAAAVFYFKVACDQLPDEGAVLGEIVPAVVQLTCGFLHGVLAPYVR